MWVFHTDPAANDFGSLFRTVADDPNSYRRPGVHTAAVGRSFYEQLLPDGSVSVGWSSIAVHWLSAVPGPLDGFWFSTASAEQYTAWAQAGVADWSAFLRARACEMLPGARLVVVAGAAHGDGPSRRSGAERAMDAVAHGLRALVGRGLVTEAERVGMTIPAWYRTAPEWRAPFADELIWSWSRSSSWTSAIRCGARPGRRAVACPRRTRPPSPPPSGSRSVPRCSGASTRIGAPPSPPSSSTVTSPVPQGYADAAVVVRDLQRAGCEADSLETVTLEGHAASAADVATGFCTGTPLRGEIEARGDLAATTRLVCSKMTARLGEGPVSAPMTAHVVQARPRGDR